MEKANQSTHRDRKQDMTLKRFTAGCGSAEQAHLKCEEDGEGEGCQQQEDNDEDSHQAAGSALDVADDLKQQHHQHR